jgi:pimeloyl-ACP methyl ester carboxylesterase
MNRSRFGPVLVALTMAGGCTSSDSSASAGLIASTDTGRSDAALSWSRCKEPELTEGTCATLSVPMDYGDAGGPTIDLALYRVHARTTRIATLIVNPGGPGATGIDYLQDAAEADLFPPGFDVISFDPRGVSRSHPVECIGEADLDSSYDTPANPGDRTELDRWLARAEQIAQQCMSTDLASTIGTTNVARDIDRLRSALGEEQINYLGFSYGARLGWTYATMFPDRVRAMVLDGPEDPMSDVAETILQQVATYEQLLEQFVGFCSTAQPARCPTDPRAAITDVLRRADAEPIPTRPGEPPLSGTYALNAVITSFYDERVWPDFGDALQAALDGDGMPLLALSFYWADRSNPRPYVSIDAQELIYCSDRVERLTTTDFDEIRQRVATLSETFSEWVPGHVPYCYGYPVGDDPTPSPGSVETPPLLVVSSTGDVATPLAGAKHLVDALGNARLLIRDGPGHTSYGQSPCIGQYVDAYLSELTLPAPSTTCDR